MGRRLSGLGMVIHTLPCDKEFDSASSRFARACSRATGVCPFCNS